MRAGGLIVSGTDTPNAFQPSGELIVVRHGRHEHLRRAEGGDCESAKALAARCRTIEAGKLADLRDVDGDPLVDIANAHRVRRVIANGRPVRAGDLIGAAHHARARRLAPLRCERIQGSRERFRS